MLRTIRSRLTFAFIAMAVGPLIVIGTLLTWQSVATEKQRALRVEQEVARRIASDISNYIGNYARILRASIATHRLYSLTPRQQKDALGPLQVHEKAFAKLVMLDENGAELFSLSRSAILPKLVSRAHKDEYIQPKLNRRVFFSNIWIDAHNGEPILTLGVPLENIRSGHFEGVLVAEIRVRRLWDLVAEMDLQTEESVCVVDSRNRVVVHRDPSVVLRKTIFIPPKQDGEHPGLTGEDSIVVVKSLQLGDEKLTVVVERSMKEALAPAIGAVWTVVWTLLIVFTLASLTAIIMLRSLVRPISSLRDVAVAIQDGDLSSQANEDGSSEISELAGAFNRMTTQLRETLEGLEEEIARRTLAQNDLARLNETLEQRVENRTTDLREANSFLMQLKTAMEQSMDGISMTNMDGNIVFVNEAWATMHGFTSQELIGQHRRLFHTAEQWNSEVIPFIEVAKAQGNNEGEVAHMRKNGDIFPTRTSISLLQDTRGEPAGFVSIVRDITDRKKAQAELEEIQRELLDASRKAGMADVATGVLHNVGNVLNSANVASNNIAETLRRSKTSEVAQAGHLVGKHVDDMVDFVTNHPQGRHLGKYLAEVAAHLEQEQTVMREATKTLRKSLSHIEQIVSMQQTYSKAVGVRQSVSPCDLVDNAVELVTQSFERRGIEISRDYQEDLPMLSVDKHTVLEILINLISNAEYSLCSSKLAEKHLTLRVFAPCDESIVIEVEDNGVGIPAENLARVFAYGFSTKQTGHGFGLHSGANAAKVLGGSLIAYSDGEGKGARFRLELPLLAAEQPAEVAK